MSREEMPKLNKTCYAVHIDISPRSNCTTDGVLVARFRGRRLEGHILELPDNMSGSVFERGQETRTITSAANTDVGMELSQESDGGDGFGYGGGYGGNSYNGGGYGASKETTTETETVLKCKSAFESFTYWNLDKPSSCYDGPRQWVEFMKYAKQARSNEYTHQCFQSVV